MSGIALDRTSAGASCIARTCLPTTKTASSTCKSRSQGRTRRARFDCTALDEGLLHLSLRSVNSIPGQALQSVMRSTHTGAEPFKEISVMPKQKKKVDELSEPQP